MKAKALFLALPLLLVSCGGDKLYFDRPSDWLLGLWITEKASYKELKDYLFLPGGMGGDIYLDPAYKDEVKGEGEDLVLPARRVEYTLAGYPDVSDPPRVVEIYITDPDVTFYGLNIVSTEAKIEETLTGWSKGIMRDGLYRRGKAYIHFWNNTVTIGVTSTNNEGIVF